MEALQKILGTVNGTGFIYEPMDEEAKERFLADCWNRGAGNLNEEDGYNCEACRNKGTYWTVAQRPDGHWTTFSNPCKCKPIRRTIRRMQRSGLKNIIRDYTFDKYLAAETWQQTIKGAAEEYVKNPVGWFSICGQSGAGKTHLCTAICREFLLAGKEVKYMLWRDDIAKIKGLALEPEQRVKLINDFKTAEVLYIDDLFKTGKNPDGGKQRPTSADINTAFEIINYRYCNPGLPTIVSSEWTMDELLDIDEATGGRIFEKAGAHGFSVAPDRSKNYRTRKITTV